MKEVAARKEAAAAPTDRVNQAANHDATNHCDEPLDNNLQNDGPLEDVDGRSAQRNDAPIPRPARRATFERDGERCSFVSVDGERCPARSWLEVDHISPRARGGSNHETNLRVLCRAHNQLLAEDAFGRSRVLAGQRRRKGIRSTSPSRVERENRTSPSPDDFETAQRALKRMGFKDTETRRAVAALRSRHHTTPQLEQILRDALNLLTSPADRQPLS